jgi:hypothetical protein
MSLCVTGNQPAAVVYKGGQKPVPQQSTAPQLDTFQPSSVDPHETGLDVLRAARETFKLPIEQTYQATKDFITVHPFFHHGVMELPIGGGKHFRNVPFIGPYHMLSGILTGNESDAAKGREVTRGTWDAG